MRSRTKFIAAMLLLEVTGPASNAWGLDINCPPRDTLIGTVLPASYGWAAANVGDINKNGVADFIIGADAEDSVALNAGRATVYDGATNAIIWEFHGTLASDLFGWSVAGAGDVDGDGFLDVVVGATGADVGATVNAGSAFVFSGQTGALLHTLHQAGVHHGIGWDVAGIGDVNSDGFDDVIATTTVGKGGAYVFSGLTGGLLYSYVGSANGVYLGYAVTGLGDVTGDLVPDFVISEPRGTGFGNVYVYSGATGILFRSFTNPLGYGEFGYDVADAGDLTGDGFSEIIIGHSYGNSPYGNAFVYDVVANTLLHTLHDPPAGEFGKTVAGISDIDGDGLVDLAVGDPGGYGYALLYSGATGTLHLTLRGERSGDRFGTAIAGMGDRDANGFGDLVIGAPNYGGGLGTTYGRTYGYYLDIDADGDNFTANCDCNEGDPLINPATAWYRDQDGDGYGLGYVVYQCLQPVGYVLDNTDCNDNNPAINPATVWYQDADGDGFGDPGTTLVQCVKPAGYVLDGSDCDDTDPGINPNTVWYADADGDGFGDPGATLTQCLQPVGYLLDNSDCDDTDPAINPNTVWYEDADGDGFGNPGVTLTQCTQPPNYVLDNTDCDDVYAHINPNTVWYQDSDSDGFGDPMTSITQCVQPLGYVLDNTDCNDLDVDINPNTVWYEDADADGFGNAAITQIQCMEPSGYVLDNTDCDDTDWYINPITVWYEDADGDGFGNAGVTLTQCLQPSGYLLDDTDCDDTDPGINPNTVWYEDADGDGFGNAASTLIQCLQPSGYLLDDTDCDDTDPGINPNTVWYEDADGDGFGNPASTLIQCLQPSGYLLDNTDCDDTDPDINPDTPWYEDADGDGFGNPASVVTQCVQPEGYLLDDSDCDDNDPAINPNTIWYADVDGDGYGDIASILVQCVQPAAHVLDHTDCDDTLAFVYPGAPELCNGIDDNCDLVVDEGLCLCHGDPVCDGAVNVLDVVTAVNIAFRSQPPTIDPGCSRERTDVSCDGATNVIDVVKFVNVAFRSGDPAVEFCEPCQ